MQYLFLTDRFTSGSVWRLEREREGLEWAAKVRSFAQRNILNSMSVNGLRDSYNWQTNRNSHVTASEGTFLRPDEMLQKRGVCLPEIQFEYRHRRFAISICRRSFLPLSDNLRPKSNHARKSPGTCTLGNVIFFNCGGRLTGTLGATMKSTKCFIIFSDDISVECISFISER